MLQELSEALESNWLNECGTGVYVGFFGAVHEGYAETLALSWQ